MPALDLLQRGEAAELTGDFVQATAAYETVLSDSDPRLVAEARFRLGRVAWRQGRYDAAADWYDQARALAVQIGDDEIRARSENGVGAVHYARGAYAQARAAYRVALELTADVRMRAKVHLNLGVLANIEGDFDTALAHYAESRAAFQRLGDGGGEALALHNLGMLHADQQRWEDADACYRLALERCERQGNRQMVANVLVNRSELRCGRGRFEEAVSGCDAALAIYDEIGDDVGRGEALRWRGHAQRMLGRLDHAEQSLREAVRIAHRSHVPLLEAEAMRELGALAASAGATTAAAQWYERALALFTALGARRDELEVRAEHEALLHRGRGGARAERGES